ncbi:unnamed protein product, partial [Musa textilis]
LESSGSGAHCAGCGAPAPIRGDPPPQSCASAVRVANVPLMCVVPLRTLLDRFCGKRVMVM